MTGSSPLARGLPFAPPIPACPQRIIPARAGFTRSEEARQPSAWDHPRSRGVYVRAIITRCVSSGSSPLARGLRDHYPRARPAAGIIPARAGFTVLVRAMGVAPADHPRSRGVYPSGAFTTQSPDGSSPLARGLHRPGSRVARGAGIIPARAGFTLGCGCVLAGWRDHPRSRGVYGRTTRTSSMSRGSSPLARGLPGLAGGDGSAVGIIPARAGFTPRVQEPGGAPTDHPRSRGVYAIGGVRRDCEARIIPARAGFTGWPPQRRSSSEDHPRSRGVYRPPPRRQIGLRGSSPLARGLPAGAGPSAQPRRIIPARAGFTLANPWNPNEPVLYQTPAAFTADPGPVPSGRESSAVVRGAARR